MKVLFLFLLCIVASTISLVAQNQETDSMKLLLKTAPADSNRMRLLLSVASTYYFSKPDSCLWYSREALDLARKLNRPEGKIRALNFVGEALRFLGDYPGALKTQMEALEISKKMNDKEREAASLGYIGQIYVEFKESRLGLQYMLTTLALNRESSNQLLLITFNLTNIGNAYDALKMPDSALYYQRLAYGTYSGLKHGPLKSLILTRYGNAFAANGNTDSALIYYNLGLQNTILIKDGVNKPKIQRKIAELYESTGQYDSSLYYASQAFKSGSQSAQSLELLETSELLAKLFRRSKNADSTLFYKDIAIQMTDRLYGPQKFKELQLLLLEEQKLQQKIVRDQDRFKNKIKYSVLLSSLGVLLLLGFILLRNNRQKQKANTILETTLSNLKSTQAQLIQSEKMASLGELTAGIAHEIQNPLNFVNNFSEVNKELLVDMKNEMDKGNLVDAKEIANDVIANEEKINHHGKRADAIVKSMLQHSNKGTGKKEPTDINALAEEYLRLSYQGFRAKDKSLPTGQAGFNVNFETRLDPDLPKIEVIPQDIGRVLLNIINNAFYACFQQQSENLKLGSNEDYKPLVVLTTKFSASLRPRLNGEVGQVCEICISDNGPGIPAHIKDKIFQPFFTTKPTGQGTGLGLSLAYDIVKAHGGTIQVKSTSPPVGALHKESSDGSGTEFVITLPLKINEE